MRNIGVSPNDFFQHAFDVRKIRPIFVSGQPLTTNDPVDFSLSAFRDFRMPDHQQYECKKRRCGLQTCVNHHSDNILR